MREGEYKNLVIVLSEKEGESYRVKKWKTVFSNDMVISPVSLFEIPYNPDRTIQPQPQIVNQRATNLITNP